MPRYAQVLVGMSLLESAITPGALGQDAIINNLPALLTSQSTGVTYIAMSSALAAAGCVFSAYTQLFLAPGVNSWGEAFEFLSPTGYSMQNGQAALTQLIMATFNYTAKD